MKIFSPSESNKFPQASIECIKSISSYFSKTLVQNYLAYKYVMTHSPNDESIEEYATFNVETPVQSASLNDAEEIKIIDE